MGRIRTIKPEFFKHEALFDAECETGLPLRLAFAGIWTICDKAGRFEWRPRAIKTDVLPYDEVDFSRVLDALATRGFLVRYRVGEKEYGHVPGFERHQVINNRESESRLPAPDADPENTGEMTLAPRVTDASSTRHGPAQAEGEGEGEREGEEYGADAPLSDEASDDPPAPPKPAHTLDQLQEAVEAFNQAAIRQDWPTAQRLNDQRRAALRARLKEAGGLDGWGTAIAKAEASDFICGRTDKQWTGFSFDWLIGSKNFTKIMEGNYDNRSSTARSRPSGGTHPGRSERPGGLVGAAMRSRSA
ncbi:hypothetical protein [Paracoccus sp. SY]|uniref:hypothetical protein n=1 Tax=Paracoccus sp. SY TaxID=1330255 RepID=UPI000CD0BA8F|nr:hypothetical protein [Paracoccus sp. SY]